MNHFYQDIKGWMNEQNTIMLDEVIDLLKPNSTWVELGTWLGRSTAYCVVELINKQKLGKFYCVDDFSGGVELKNENEVKNDSLKEEFNKNMTPINDKIKVIDSLSWESSKYFDNSSIDFCYVDAGHTYECVKKDLESWWPKIKTGGYFGGDDYTRDFKGLQLAVNSFFEEKNIEVKKIGRCWLVRKEYNGKN